MASQGRKRSRVQDRLDKEESRRKRRTRGRNLLVGGVVTLIAVLVVSTYVFIFLVGTIEGNRPELEIVDIVGTKPSEGSETIVQVKITVRNTGGGALDMEDAVLTWKGPGVDATLRFNGDDPTRTDKDSFGVGGVGLVKDGWDPEKGSYKVKVGTVAWLLVNLTIAEGIGDVLGPDHGITVKVRIGGAKVEAEGSFKVPGDLGDGRFVALRSV